MTLILCSGQSYYRVYDANTTGASTLGVLQSTVSVPMIQAIVVYKNGVEDIELESLVAAGFTGSDPTSSSYNTFCTIAFTLPALNPGDIIEIKAIINNFVQTWLEELDTILVGPLSISDVTLATAQPNYAPMRNTAGPFIVVAGDSRMNDAYFSDSANSNNSALWNTDRSKVLGFYWMAGVWGIFDVAATFAYHFDGVNPFGSHTWVSDLDASTIELTLTTFVNGGMIGDPAAALTAYGAAKTSDVPSSDILQIKNAVGTPSSGTVASGIAAIVDKLPASGTIAKSGDSMVLASNGLDAISTSGVDTGPATSFVGMVKQIWRDLWKPVTKTYNAHTNSGVITRYDDAGTPAPVATQAYTDDGAGNEHRDKAQSPS